MNNNLEVLEKLENIIKTKKNQDPNSSYTASLFKKGKQKIANKLGEEAFETVTAFLSQNKEDLSEETADLIYHLFVLLEFSKVDFDCVLQVLNNRMKEKSD